MPAQENEYNYPDILGYITDKQRINFGVLQVAMAIRPSVARVGRPFEVIVVMQNASDVPVDVTLTLNAPDKDAKRNKGRFLVKTPRLVVGLEAAEVGFATLPVSTMPDTATSDNYTVSMDIDVKTLEKPQRVRQMDGGGLFSPSQLPPERVKQIESLKRLKYSVKKSGGLFKSGNGVEVEFGLAEAKVGKLAKLNPGWESLWTMQDNRDETLYLDRYGELISLHTIPALKRNGLYQNLLEKTKKRWQASGYPLKDIEADLVTRLLTLILEYANSREMAHGALAAGIYDLKPALSEKERMIRVEPIQLPHWFSAFLYAVAKDERIARVPVKAIPHFVYDELLWDAITHSFHAIEVNTGEDLGTPEEMDEFAMDVLARLKRKGKMEFTHTYMPLVLGGILLFDRILFEDEQMKDILKQIRDMLSLRQAEEDESNEPIFDMARTVIDLTLKKFGMYDQ